MNILIIGGAGFIGSYLANDLSGDHEVTVVDNLVNGDKKRLNDSIDFRTGFNVSLSDFDYVYY